MLKKLALLFYKRAKEYAPGIPEKKDFGIIPEIKKPKVIRWVVHRHQADKAGLHYDLRLNLQGNQAFSWALKNDLPQVGQRHLAVQQPVHTKQYMDFVGTIEDGYGKGQVNIHKSGNIDLLFCSPKKITFVDHGTGQQSNTYSLINTMGKDWLIINHTPIRGKQYSIPAFKPPYKEDKNKNEPDFSDPTKVHQPKVDGAHGILHIPAKGKQVRVFSYRAGKKGTGLIEHTYKIPKLMGVRSDGSQKGNYRCEIFGSKNGKSVKPQETAGLLNANTWKSREKQKEEGVELQVALFGKDKYTGDFDSLQNKLNQVAKLAPPLLTLPVAKTPEDKLKMFQEIKSGRHPITDEGVVEYDQGLVGKLKKYKFRPDFDVHVRDIFKEVSPTGRQEMAGGFDYSLTPKGPIVGRVGTGFSHDVKKDMLKNPSKYVGSVAKIQSSRQTTRGAYFQPSFKEWHMDKGSQTEKLASIALEKYIGRIV